jgi:hypothetical protein
VSSADLTEHCLHSNLPLRIYMLKRGGGGGCCASEMESQRVCTQETESTHAQTQTCQKAEQRCVYISAYAYIYLFVKIRFFAR